MGGIIINNVFVWKDNKIQGKSLMKISKNGDFWHISGIFGRKKFFSKIGLGHVMSIANMHLCAKNWKKLMMKVREMAKNQFFRHISSIFGRKNTFFENRTRSHFRHCHFSWVCQISWKNIKYRSRNSRNTVFPAKIGCSGDY